MLTLYFNGMPAEMEFKIVKTNVAEFHWKYHVVVLISRKLG